MSNSLIDKVEEAITWSKNQHLPKNITQIPGTSSEKVQLFLNHLCSGPSVRHLHIGLAQGKTFCGALFGNQPEAIWAIDYFDDNTKAKFLKNTKDSQLVPFEFYQKNCWNLSTVDKARITNVNVYFFDGLHKLEDQTQALTYFIDNLAEEFIFVVDDWSVKQTKDNMPQKGTRDGIKATNLSILKEWELYGPKQEYWNGLGVFVLRKS